MADSEEEKYQDMHCVLGEQSILFYSSASAFDQKEHPVSEINLRRIVKLQKLKKQIPEQEGSQSIIEVHFRDDNKSTVKTFITDEVPESACI